MLMKEDKIDIRRKATRVKTWTRQSTNFY